MTRHFDFKTELNASTHFYEVTTSLDSVYPNASIVLANCINSRERSFCQNSNQLKEIEVAIYVGLHKLGICGMFHQGPDIEEDGNGIITLLKGSVCM